MEIKEKLLFKTYSGSILYGTNSETSDTDYKGVFLPNKEDLLLNKAPKHYTTSTASDGQRNTSNDVDETYYSLHYFLELLAAGETNCLDLFFANTNKNTVIIEDPIWTELTKHADKIITKNINRYLGFCRSQAFKYSLKGEKLKYFQEFYNRLTTLMEEKDKNGNYITLDLALGKFVSEYSNSANNVLNEPTEYKKNDKVIGTRIKLNLPCFGDHCYFLTTLNKEQFLMISDVKFNIQETIQYTRAKVKRTMDQFGDRSAIASENNGCDYKAVSHAIRVLFQAEELITTGKITFPLKPEQIQFIKEVKYGKTTTSYPDLMKYIDERIKYINDVLLPKSTLRSNADQKWINQFILSLYH